MRLAAPFAHASHSPAPPPPIKISEYILQYVFAHVYTLHQALELHGDVCGVHLDGLARLVRGLEGDVLHDLLHDGVQTARADVLHRGVRLH
jgi:hypothetical protein